MTGTNPVPDGYRSVSPYLCVDGAEAAIAFYADVLGAVERSRIAGPGGTIRHAELVIGDSVVMLSDEFPDWGIRGAAAYGGTAVTIGVYVADVDAAYGRAIALGAQPVRPVEDQFYGDRSGQFLDPWGHRWSVATHIEDVSDDEIARRAAEVMGGG